MLCITHRMQSRIHFLKRVRIRQWMPGTVSDLAADSIRRCTDGHRSEPGYWLKSCKSPARAGSTRGKATAPRILLWFPPAPNFVKGAGMMIRHRLTITGGPQGQASRFPLSRPRNRKTASAGFVKSRQGLSKSAFKPTPPVFVGLKKPQGKPTANPVPLFS
jgi:ribosomal protein S14